MLTEVIDHQVSVGSLQGCTIITPALWHSLCRILRPIRAGIWLRHPGWYKYHAANQLKLRNVVGAWTRPWTIVIDISGISHEQVPIRGNTRRHYAMITCRCPTIGDAITKTNIEHARLRSAYKYRIASLDCSFDISDIA